MTSLTSPLAAESLSVSFGGLAALSDVTLSLKPGVVTGLIGPNGAGKSTLVNALSGMQVPTAGRIVLAGAPVRGWTLGRAARSGVGRSFQASKAFFEMTVIENLTLGAMHGPALQRGMELAELLELTGREDERAKNLSFGELRRLGVGIALTSRPDVLLLDEPGAGLTGADLTQLSEAIVRVKEAGTTILLVDHNMRFLMQTVEHVIVLVAGRIICEGTPSDVQRDERVREAYLGRSEHA